MFNNFNCTTCHQKTIFHVVFVQNIFQITHDYLSNFSPVTYLPVQLIQVICASQSELIIGNLFLKSFDFKKANSYHQKFRRFSVKSAFLFWELLKLRNSNWFLRRSNNQFQYLIRFIHNQSQSKEDLSRQCNKSTICELGHPTATQCFSIWSSAKVSHHDPG